MIEVKAACGNGAGYSEQAGGSKGRRLRRVSEAPQAAADKSKEQQSQGNRSDHS